LIKKFSLTVFLFFYIVSVFSQNTEIKKTDIIPENNKENKNILNEDNSIEDFQDDIKALNSFLIKKGVDKDWLKNNIESSFFKLHPDIGKYFNNMSETKAQKNEMDFEEYKRILWLDRKIDMGRPFIKKHYDFLIKLQSKHGIDFELISSIIGIETNFAEDRQKGGFYVFNALVSQYLFLEKRKKYASNQLYYLYEFATRTNKPVDYFIGSFAGAAGWAQFIPSSLCSLFVDSNDDDKDIDIYSVEDSLSSIENYLSKHGLNGDTISNYETLFSSVFAYNRSDFYVKAVLYIYENLKK
jgi:membrane-bound lytic murein transglycosylase B